MLQLGDTQFFDDLFVLHLFLKDDGQIGTALQGDHHIVKHHILLRREVELQGVKGYVFQVVILIGHQAERRG